jgi:replicative DNA helicase Mcm
MPDEASTILTGPEERFQEFLRTFQPEKGEYKYRKRLGQLRNIGLHYIMVDFEDLMAYDLELARLLLGKPDEFLPYLDRSSWAQLKIEDPQYAEEIKKLKVRFRNLPDTISLRKLHEHINKLVNIRGIITEGTAPAPFITKALFKCRKCLSLMTIETNMTWLIIGEPELCGRCRSKILDLQPNESEQVPCQTVTIQELPDDMESNKPPTPCDIRLISDLVDKMPIGAQVYAIGIPRLVMHRKQHAVSALPTVWFDPLWIEDASFEEKEELTEEDVEKIKETAKDSLVERQVLASICPSIYGMGDVKQAVLYQMLGGVSGYATDGSYQRGFISVLIIGDPSCGKTTLLRYIAGLVPRAHYSSAVSSSGRGLTALIGKDENGVMRLRIGAVVMSNNSICCVDELEKARPEDRVALHECMESGKITIDKGGFNTQLNAHTAILAAGNPTFGRYDPNKNITENISLAVTLLSRFDLIFVVKDIPDEASDKKIMKRIISARKGEPLVEEGHDVFDPSFLRKYIMYARKIVPKLTDEAETQSLEFYLKIRKKMDDQSPFSLAPRQGQAILRLAEARAKLHLRTEVLREDVLVAWGLLQRSLLQSGVDVETGEIDIDTIETGKPKSQLNKIELIMMTLATLEKENDPVEESKLIGNLAGDMSEFECRQLLEICRRDSLLFSPRSGYIKRVRM